MGHFIKYSELNRSLTFLEGEEQIVIPEGVQSRQQTVFFFHEPGGILSQLLYMSLDVIQQTN